MVSKPVDHGRNRGGLMGSCLPPRQARGRSSNLNRPLNFFRQEMTTQDQTHRLLLTVQRPTSRGPNVVRRSHQESVGKLRPVLIPTGTSRFLASGSLGQDDPPWLEWPTTPPHACGRRCRFRHRSPTDPANPSTATRVRTDLDTAERSARTTGRATRSRHKCRALGITADLRFDVLEAAFRQTRLGCGLHCHVWNHCSEYPAPQRPLSSHRGRVRSPIARRFNVHRPESQKLAGPCNGVRVGCASLAALGFAVPGPAIVCRRVVAASGRLFYHRYRDASSLVPSLPRPCPRTSP